VLHELVSRATRSVIEHNLESHGKTADWFILFIDLGPEGGDGGR
jgi:excinuclease UvrABC ATPase subunit